MHEPEISVNRESISVNRESISRGSRIRFDILISV